MDPNSYYSSYVFWARIALLPGNLLLVVLLIRAFLRNRAQLGFLFLGIACLGFAYTTGFHFLSSLQHRLEAQFFPPLLWRLFFLSFFLIFSLALPCCFLL